MGFVCLSCWHEGPWRGLDCQVQVYIACHPVMNKCITISSSDLKVVSCVLSQEETFLMKRTILLTYLMFGVLFLLNLWLKFVNLQAFSCCSLQSLTRCVRLRNCSERLKSV